MPAELTAPERTSSGFAYAILFSSRGISKCKLYVTTSSSTKGDDDGGLADNLGGQRRQPIADFLALLSKSNVANKVFWPIIRLLLVDNPRK